MKKLLAVVDTDEHGFIALFKNKLQDEGLTDEFLVHTVPPNLLLSLERMSEDCVSKLREAPGPIAAIFVDIVLNESRRTELNQSGIDIAKYVRHAFPSTPLFSLTGNFITESEVAAVSEASTEDVDGIMLKPYLLAKHFSASKLRHVLGRANAKRKAVASAGPAIASTASTSLREFRAHFSLADAQVHSDIDSIGEASFWHLLNALLPDVSSGVLRHIDQGRSGAVVARLSSLHSPTPNIVGQQKEWIVKLARDKPRITQECENYAQLPRTGLHKSSFPQLVSGPEEFGDVSGFVIELQSACIPLSHAIADESIDLDILVGSITGTLKALHGRSQPRLDLIWKSSFSLDFKLDEAVKYFLHDFSSIVHARTGMTAAREVTRFIESNGASLPGLFEFEPEITESLCHNDLNAGNVLVTPSHSVVLIDFSSAGRGHAARDYAKLERDVFFRCDGWGTESFHSFQKKSRVIEFARSSGEGGNGLDPKDRAFKVAQSIRAAGLAVCGSHAPIYWMALLSASVRALANPTIPVPRRVAGFTYCHEVLKLLTDSIRSIRPA